MKRKVLITGSSGFVGKNIKEYLENQKEEYELYCPSSKELNCIDEGEVEKYIKGHSFYTLLFMETELTKARMEQRLWNITCAYF